MKILVDAFGGDNSPLEVIKGAVKYVEEGGASEVCLVGKQDVIENLFTENNFSKKNITVMNADEVITCEEAPTEAFRKKPNSSICVGLDAMRKEDYDAFVSAGSTGAVLTAGVFKTGRVKGVSRPALGTLMPTVSGGQVLFLDCGANADCKPVNLVHFAIMADVYMKNVAGIENPRIGLLSNGAEDQKGNELIKTVNGALRSLKSINFIGNVEGRDIMSGVCDIVVTDGFSGNVALKSIEGAANTILGVLKTNIKKSLMAMIGFKFFMKKAFKNTLKVMNYKDREGAVFLGVNGVIVKAHGSSKAPAFVHAIRQAEKAASTDINTEIASRLQAEEIKELIFE